MRRHVEDDDGSTAAITPYCDAKAAQHEGGETDVDVSIRRKGWCCGSIVVEPMIVLYVMSGLPMMTISSQYMLQKVAETMNITMDDASNGSSCHMNKSSMEHHEQELVQAQAAMWNIYQSLAHFIPGFIAPIVIGAIGDKVGRRWMFILPSIGSICSVLVYMAMIWFDLPIYFIFLTTIEYVFGGMGALFMGGFAYIADTVPPEKRAFRMTILDVVTFSNAAIANLFVGYWIRAEGFFWPLVFVLGGKVLSLIYAIFIIPDTISKSSRTNKKMSATDLLNGLRVLYKDNGTGRRWRINVLLFVYFIGEILSSMTVRQLFEMNSPLCWGPVLLGYYAFASMMFQSVMMLVAAKIPNSWISLEGKVLISRVSGAISYTYMAFVYTTFMMFMTPLLGAFSFLAIPMIRAIISTKLEKNEQASVFAIMSALFNVGMFASSIAMNKIYAETVFFMEGFVFLPEGAANTLGIICMIMYIVFDRRDHNRYEKMGSIQVDA